MSTSSDSERPGQRVEHQQAEIRTRWGERLRFMITAALLVLLAAIVLAPVFGGLEDWSQYKEWLNIVLPVLTGFVGSALGYFFGVRAREGEGSLG